MALDVKPNRPGKGAPPPPEATSNKLAKRPSGQRVHQQVKIPPEIRREFRAYAAEHDMDLGPLFEDIWRFYKSNHG